MMKFYKCCFINSYTIAISALCLLLITSCNITLKVKDGNEAYDLKKYALASEMLQEDYERAKDKNQKYDIAVKIAKSYLAYSQTDKAENWYKRAVNLDVNPEAYFGYAMVLKQNEKYEEAILNLKSFYEYDRSQRIIVEGHIEACEDAIEAMKGENYTVVTNLLEVNSPQSDYAPNIIDGNLYFSSNRQTDAETIDDWTGKSYTDIYIAPQQSLLKFEEANAMEEAEVNTPFHEAVVTYNTDRTELYFTRCGMDDDNKDVCKIFTSFKEFGEWSTPEQLQFFSDTTNEAHPFLADDGNSLYFTSDAIFGYGGKDLYVSKRLGEEWDVAINLGPRVNTIHDEMFPVISEDGKLYFSSNGHYGIGGLDLFVAEKRGRIFTNPKSIGYPVNTGADELTVHLLESEDDSVEITGYLASNRSGGAGFDDIYFFEKRLQPEPPLPPAVFVLKGLVEEKEYEDPKNPTSAVIGKAPLNDVNSSILDNTDSKKPYLIAEMMTSDSGQFETILDENVDYLVEFSKKGYFSQKNLVSTKNYEAEDGDTIVINTTAVLEKIYEEIEFILNIYYDLDKANIRPDAEPVLDSLANLLIENPTLQVELASHTDSRGDDPYNLSLSQRRADSAVQYLIGKGIQPERLIARGYGETQLVNRCKNGVTCTEEEHQKNRRTTFKVVGTNFKLISE